MLFIQKALAKNFTRFEPENSMVDFDYKYGASDIQNEVILTTSGKLIWAASLDFKPDFIISAKISKTMKNCRILHTKLKIC